tara:strand:+ start:956 stop:1138 length:183 start_codon:yes stop_codon:yes gene_type:complete
MDERLVLLAVTRGIIGSPAVYRLAYGKVLPNGKTIYKASIKEEMCKQLGIQRGQTYLGNS